MRADVAVAFDIIEALQKQGYHERLNLRQTDFRKLSLANRTLHNADFHGSDFRNSDLFNIDLTGSDFYNCDFLFCTEMGDDLPVYWDRATLHNTRWVHTEFKEVFFRQCDFSGAYFDHTKLASKTEFRACKFSGAGFQHVYLGHYENGKNTIYLSKPEDIKEKIFADGNLTWIDGQDYCSETWPTHWSKDDLSRDAFELSWRAFQKSIGFDPENPEGSA
ncbi:pentapeptide repeat-containing protein [Halocynthiibacter sp.]|uniref:pentapeptide repeat-containing protein n=1 Tax=Halocynthiibacter sp. TaxID=1979210 RepID=UPI003C3F9D4C